MSTGGAQHIVLGPYFNAAGVLYPSIKVYIYAAGTLTAKTAWSDEAKTTPLAQPFIGDTSGIARFFADGDYKFIIKDTNDNTLYTWDSIKVTSDEALMWEAAEGTAYPSAGAGNRWQMFGKHSAANALEELGVNDGTAFRKLVQLLSGYTGFAFDKLVTKNHPVADVTHPDFGADPTGVNDSTTAINNALSSTSGVAFMPPGTYIITADSTTSNWINIPANKWLIGSGPATIIKIVGTVANSGSPYYVRLNGADSGLFNLTIDMNADNLSFQAGTGVTDYGAILVGGAAGQGMNPATRARLENLVIKNAKQKVPADGFDRNGLGIDLFNAPYAQVSNIIFMDSHRGLFMTRDFPSTITRYNVSNITGINMTWPTILLEFGENDVVNNVIIFAAANSPRAGIQFQDIYNTQLSNVTIHGGQLWSRLSDAGAIINTHISNVQIMNVPTAGGVTGYGIDMNRLVNTTFSDVTVSDCASHGIYLSGGTSGASVKLTNVQSVSNDANGFLLNQVGKFDLVNCSADSNNQHGIQINPGPSAVTLTGCTARNNSQSAAGTYDGLRINTSRVSVIGGRYYDDQGTPTQNYGIYEQITSGNNLVTDVLDLSGNVGGKTINPAGSSTTITNNKGYNPVGISTITPTSGVAYTAGSSPETIYIYGGQVDDVIIGGLSVAVSSPAQVELPPNVSVTIMFFSSPTFTRYIH